MTEDAFTPKVHDFKAGFVGIIGRPNVGKSTILNSLIGYRISIITPKPQTTRNTLLGIANRENSQIAFFDTPGMHLPKDKLGRFMVKEVRKVISDSDVLVFVADAKQGFNKEDFLLIKELNKFEKPIIFSLNKIDLVKDKRQILPLLNKASTLFDFNEYLPLSAKTGENLGKLLTNIEKFLPQSEKLFPQEYITDSPDHFIISEIIREELLRLTHQEIPYSAAVLINRISYREKKDLTYILATIYTEKNSQKKIVIGHNGIKIKQIGKNARVKLESFLRNRVYLELKVKVLPKWKKDNQALRKLGYSIN